MNRKYIVRIATFVLSVALLAGCNKQPSAPSAGAPEPGDSAQVITTDREGNAIALPAEINRIVSLSPTITEMLVDLGLGDKIVAVDKYSLDIEGLPADLPAYDMMTPDAESLVALKADVLLVSGMSKKGGDDPYKPVSDAGTPVAYIPSSSSIAAIGEDVLFLGTILGRETEAQAIVEDMLAQVNALAAIGDAIPADARRTVYFEIMPEPSLYSFGTGTFLNEIIELAGATNVLADQSAWVSISEEAVLSRNPDVILTNWSEGADITGEIMGRNGWDALPAVRDGRVCRIDRDSSSRSNHRITKAMWEIAQAIYPEYYTEN